MQSKEAQKIYNSKYYQRNKEKINLKRKEWFKEYYKNNKDKEDIRKKKWREKNKEKLRAYSRKLQKKYTLKKLGISLDDYNKIVKEQAGHCAICGRKAKLIIEHCHKCNKFRGLTCYLCNQIMGAANDNIAVLYKVIEFLKKHQSS